LFCPADRRGCLKFVFLPPIFPAALRRLIFPADRA
jgi:hypothetical protein